jgi:hypothetical protein
MEVCATSGIKMAESPIGMCSPSEEVKKSSSQELQEFRSCRMGRWLPVWMVTHPLPCDEEFDSANSES